MHVPLHFDYVSVSFHWMVQIIPPISVLDSEYAAASVLTPWPFLPFQYGMPSAVVKKETGLYIRISMVLGVSLMVCTVTAMSILHGIVSVVTIAQEQREALASMAKLKFGYFDTFLDYWKYAAFYYKLLLPPFVLALSFTLDHFMCRLAHSCFQVAAFISLEMIKGIGYLPYNIRVDCQLAPFSHSASSELQICGALAIVSSMLVMNQYFENRIVSAERDKGGRGGAFRQGRGGGCSSENSHVS